VSNCEVPKYKNKVSGISVQVSENRRQITENTGLKTEFIIPNVFRLVLLTPET
jgi:hypothetical protein